MAVIWGKGAKHPLLHCPLAPWDRERFNCQSTGTCVFVRRNRAFVYLVPWLQVCNSALGPGSRSCSLPSPLALPHQDLRQATSLNHLIQLIPPVPFISIVGNPFLAACVLWRSSCTWPGPGEPSIPMVSYPRDQILP